MKKIIKEEISTVHWEISTELSKAIEYLQSLEKQASEKGVKYFLDYDTEYGGYGDDDRQVIRLLEERYETDKEYAKRVEDEKLQSEQNLARKIALFEELKKELGE